MTLSTPNEPTTRTRLCWPQRRDSLRGSPTVTLFASTSSLSETATLIRISSITLTTRTMEMVSLKVPRMETSKIKKTMGLRRRNARLESCVIR